MYDLTSLQRDLLYVIAGLDSPTGLDVRDELGDYYGRKIPPGRLHPNLHTLVDRGLVKDEDKKERIVTYTITSHGKQELADRQAWKTNILENIS